MSRIEKKINKKNKKTGLSFKILINLPYFNLFKFNFNPINTFQRDCMKLPNKKHTNLGRRLLSNKIIKENVSIFSKTNMRF